MEYLILAVIFVTALATVVYLMERRIWRLEKWVCQLHWKIFLLKSGLNKQSINNEKPKTKAQSIDPADRWKYGESPYTWRDEV